MICGNALPRPWPTPRFVYTPSSVPSSAYELLFSFVCCCFLRFCCEIPFGSLVVKQMSLIVIYVHLYSGAVPSTGIWTLKSLMAARFKKNAIAIPLNLLQFGPSLVPFLFNELFKLCFDVSSGYILLWLIWWPVLICWLKILKRVTNFTVALPCV